MPASLRAELDHKNLNHQVPRPNEEAEDDGKPGAISPRTRRGRSFDSPRATCMSGSISLPRYWDDGGFFLECSGHLAPRTACTLPVSPRPEQPLFTASATTRAVMATHYLTEATIGGPYEERSGTLYSFAALLDGIEGALLAVAGQASGYRDREEFRSDPFDRRKHRARSGRSLVHAVGRSPDAPAPLGDA